MCPYFLVIGFSNVVLYALAMQCNIPSYVRFSSSVSFTASFDELTIDTSHNPIVGFPKFFKMLTVRSCSSLFSALVVFSGIILELDTAPALRWPCWWRKGSSGRRKLEKT